MGVERENGRLSMLPFKELHESVDRGFQGVCSGRCRESEVCGSAAIPCEGKNCREEWKLKGMFCLFLLVVVVRMGTLCIDLV